jgi:hypothetical protein
MSKELQKKEDHRHGKPLLELTINSKKHEWKEQYILGSQVRKLGNIPHDDKIFLDIEKPWDDELIEDSTNVNLARPGIEQFFSLKNQDIRLVNIKINDVEKKISRGRHTVVEIKKLGDVPLAHELEELINGQLIPLPDDGKVLIKGGEIFFSHPKDGSSS